MVFDHSICSRTNTGASTLCTYIEVVNKAFVTFLIIRIANQSNANFIFYNPHNKIRIMFLKRLLNHLCVQFIIVKIVNVLLIFFFVAHFAQIRTEPIIEIIPFVFFSVNQIVSVRS